MVRPRSVAAKARASTAPYEVSRRLSFLVLAALLAVAGCSSATVRGEPSNLSGEKGGPSSSQSTTTPVATPTTKPGTPLHATTTTTPAQRRIAVEVAVLRAWSNAKDEFYRAALLGEPEFPPFLATLVVGGPVYDHSVAYLTGLAAAGVVGPAVWRVGNARVVALTATRARVEGCLWDTGSVWKASGHAAPASLGGGTGLTASDALLELEHGKWLVLDDAVAAVTSSKEQGPCHGF